MKKYILILGLLWSTGINAQNLLLIPDTISGTVFNLNIAPGTRTFYPGFTTNTIGVNGDYLGPTLMVRNGDIVTMNVTNNLTDTTTLHWHGLHVPAQADGGPHITIEPGATWSPTFQIKDKASMYWYHPHLHMKTAEHVTKGAAGLIYVRDSESDSLMLPVTYGVDDIPLVVQTRAFDAAKQFQVVSALDTSILINGTINAYCNLPAQIVRLRLLNAATERAINFGFSNNQTFFQIGSDGGLLAGPVSMSRLLLVPGERAEILVDLSALNGQTINLINYGAQISSGIYGATNPQAMGPNIITGYTSNPLNGSNFNLLTINITAPTTNPITAIPSSLVNVQPIPSASANKTRDFVFSPQVMGPTGSLIGPFVINMMSFDMMMINDTVNLNDVEIWQLTNQTRISHPFHVHDVHFYILDINGVPPSAGMSGRKDVVLVPPQNGIVRIIAKFEDYADPVFPYMYHCHMLTHEDDGMMGQFIVVDSTSGIAENSSPDHPFEVFPNPSVTGFANLVWLGSTESSAKLIMYDNTGKVVSNKIIKLNRGDKSLLDFVGLQQGIYTLSLHTGKEIYYEKVVVIDR